MTIVVIYENGVFRPLEQVDVPDHCEVEIEIRQVQGAPKVPTLDNVYEIVSRRNASGEHNLAKRHNEHQPGVSCFWILSG